MISDKKLALVSLAVSLAGLAFLFFITLAIEPKEVVPKEITDSLVGQEVVVKGVIASYRAKDGNVFLTFNESSIKVVMFSRDAQKQPWVYDLRKGDFVSVQGKVQLYKNELEIVAKNIKAVEFS